MSHQTSSVGSVPSHWEIKKLKYVASLKSGEFIDADSISDAGDYPVFGGNGIRGYTSQCSHCGDYVLIGRQGALCGNVNYASGCFWATEHAVVVNIFGEDEVTWLGELLRYMNLNQYSQAAAQPGLAVEVIANLEIPVPPLEEQRLLARYIKVETAHIDSLLVEKGRVLDLLAEKRRALITQAVTRGLDPNVRMRDSGIPWLGEIPAHWPLVHLRRVLSSMDYGISTAVEPAGEVIVLRMGDIQDGEIDFARVGYVDEVDPYLLLQTGDLLFNRTNSLDQVGKVALFRGLGDHQVSFASYLVRLRCNSRILSDYLNMLLNSAYVQAWCRSEALPAIGQANLNPNRYGYLPICLPPIDEQMSIIKFIADGTSKINEVLAATERTIALLKERRATIITAAVTGQIEVGSAE